MASVSSAAPTRKNSPATTGPPPDVGASRVGMPSTSVVTGPSMVAGPSVVAEPSVAPVPSGTAVCAVSAGPSTEAGPPVSAFTRR